MRGWVGTLVGVPRSPTPIMLYQKYANTSVEPQRTPTRVPTHPLIFPRPYAQARAAPPLFILVALYMPDEVPQVASTG
jgi:hypothetical protein